MKHLLALTTLTLALPFLTTATAFADREHNPEFRQIVRVIEQNPEAVDATIVYDSFEKVSSLSPSDLAAFNEIANDQAQIWGDTILEGDYQADGNTELDSVEKLELKGQFVGYRVFYSERAWETSSCDYNGEPESLEGCTEGRIQEASFVSKELNNWTRDPSNYAEFND